MERRLMAIAGSEASDIHIGRSRQDLHGTVRRMLARKRVLDVYAHLQESHTQLVGTAEQHLETVIPAYTHGVPSQPTTFAHQLLAYGASIERTTESLRQAFNRLNHSPLGSGAGTTSGIEIDRPMLARLLGFSGPVENSYGRQLHR